MQNGAALGLTGEVYHSVPSCTLATAVANIALQSGSPLPAFRGAKVGTAVGMPDKLQMATQLSMTARRENLPGSSCTRRCWAGRSRDRCTAACLRPPPPRWGTHARALGSQQDTVWVAELLWRKLPHTGVALPPHKSADESLDWSSGYSTRALPPGVVRCCTSYAQQFVGSPGCHRWVW